MILNGTLGAIVTADRQLADAAHMQKDVLGHLGEYGRAAHADDGLVKGDIRGRIIAKVLVGPMRLVEVREHRAKAPDVGVARHRGDQARGDAFECRPGLHHFYDFAFVFLDDQNATARYRAQESVLL